MTDKTLEQWTILRSIFQVGTLLGPIVWAFGTVLSRALLVLLGVGLIFTSMSGIAGTQLLAAKSTNERVTALVFEALVLSLVGILLGLNDLTVFPASIPDGQLLSVSMGVFLLFIFVYIYFASSAESEPGGEHV